MLNPKTDDKIWFDNQWLPWDQANIHVLTHSLHYGLAVFEGVRAYKTSEGSAIFRLQEHTKRLFQSAHILNMTIPYSEQEIIDAQCELIKRNQQDECYIRPICFYGSEDMGLRAQNLTTHVAIASWNWPSYLNPEDKELGIPIKTSSYTRGHVNSVMTKAKACGHYINSILALEEALSNGAKEALLLDQYGFIAEGSGENIFLVFDGELHTPTTKCCLNGITRQTIMTLAKYANIKIVERDITRDEVYLADEAFFTGTAAEVLPIQSLDNRIIGNGKRGPITLQLQSEYFSAVKGEHPLSKLWLTPLN